jgi:hypothetical protein
MASEKQDAKQIDERLAQEQIHLQAEIFALQEMINEKRARLTTIKDQRGGIKLGLEHVIVAETKVEGKEG